MFSINRGSDDPQKLKKINDIFIGEIKNLDKEKAYEHYKKHKGKFKYNTLETKKKFREMNFERCSFCTKYISEFDDEMTVEHIKLKSEYPEKIFNWDNLLCACKTCNTKRSTNLCDDNLYLDPTKIENIEKYFKFKLDGKIEPSKSLAEKEIEKSNYMIELYKLNRKGLVCSRRKFFNDLIEDDEFYEILKNRDNFNQNIIFLALFTYYKRRENNE